MGPSLHPRAAFGRPGFMKGHNMPWLASKEDELISRLIGSWKRTAIDEIDDIGGWRDHAVERAHFAGDPRREWSNPPRMFNTDTSYLCAWIRLHHPNVDPTPMEDIAEAVEAWHRDHGAEYVVDQRVRRGRARGSSPTPRGPRACPAAAAESSVRRG